MWRQRLLSHNVLAHGCHTVSTGRWVRYRPMAVTLWGMSFYSACERVRSPAEKSIWLRGDFSLQDTVKHKLSFYPSMVLSLHKPAVKDTKIDSNISPEGDLDSGAICSVEFCIQISTYPHVFTFSTSGLRACGTPRLTGATDGPEDFINKRLDL